MDATRTVRDSAEVKPDQLYSFAAAARFIPSAYGDTDSPITPQTLHNWREQGLFVAAYRVVGRKKHYLIRGSDILLLIGIEPKASKPRQRGRARASDLEELRAAGFDV